MFQVAADVIEIGLGVHGEAGVGQVPLTTANLAVKKLIDHMTNPGIQTLVEYSAEMLVKALTLLTPPL